MKQSLILLILTFQSVFSNRYRYIFAQEWPGTICKSNSCEQQYIRQYSGQKFSIHGLWPDIDATTHCKDTIDCTHETYNPQSLSQKTHQLLDVSWVGFYSDIDQFRSHEWTKHGTCWQGQPLVQSEFRQESYFLTVHELWKTYDLFDGLAQAGVHPSNENFYQYQRIIDGIKIQIQKVIGDRFIGNNMIQFQCQKNKINGYSMLQQVNICLDDNYMPMDCSCSENSLWNLNNNCGDQILFPQFNTNQNINTIYQI